MIHFLIPILILAPTPSREQNVPMSPCRGVFDYEPIGEERGRWYGTIHLLTDTPLRAIWLEIELDGKADLLGNWIGEVTTRNNMNYRIENTQYSIKPDSPVDVRIFVQFDFTKKAPKLKSIKFNGREICNADNLQPSFGLSDVRTNPPETSTMQSWTPPTESTTKIIIQTPEPPVPTAPVQEISIKPTVTAPNVLIKGSDEIKCGTVVNEVPLVVLGTKTIEGQWPWQIALYEALSSGNNFTCGGTLVTHRHIVTAAHCTTRNRSKRLKDPNTFLVFLGKYNLQTTTYGVQTKFVEDVLLHPEYNPENFYADVSIITLIDSVIYTNRVRPACLWPENLIPLSNVVGKKGSVVGWGYDITGVITAELNLVEMQVVDIETCLRSRSEFFNRFTSNYTFCAGNNDGSSACNGDSGGGMMFKLDDDSWYLRGIVSIAVASPNDNRCDPNYYVVFADAAKFLTWIKSNIYDY